MSRPIVIAAGGTGGHFFPAEALATELAARGHDLVLMTDKRAGRRTSGIFADRPQHVLPGTGVAGKGMLAKLRGVTALLRGAWAARALHRTLRPAAVIGFGGYPSVPPILGCCLLTGRNDIQIVLHEGNAVLGQANALLSRFASAIATSFPTVARLPLGLPTTLTGMPVRPGIEALAGETYTPPQEAIHLLVWGGSLGARVFSETVPAALALMPAGFRARLHVTQQVHENDIPKVREQYEAAGIDCTLSPFFTDVAQCLREAHLVIGRAGGSSVAELAIAGRPSLLVPLPIAASDEQGANAQQLMDHGGAWMMRQDAFTPDSLSAFLGQLLGDPDRLSAAARAARSFAHPGSARLLADLVEARIARAGED
ncbi:UDP-N-acetylglucosamine--N-acetylmuramyl-(pentapeptide) pyrophosphoryl-undecaprenol N-acetylglucosamine transferase [Swaminathania salitolerans]|uniref:UDP-N-acetylglucosamine--N-acetylmuramyl-(pentapeptide) pyrophosphoryl-undecaprenol N-acetylglucosamine transferase n=1 Tax=Swaminathania salitolerans TaxID=182838 RepID=A0A511BPI0_9PROT|nr:UDP-N-acetylglucosamine--N-acetylmuramyl-(pentapeptide) pyrophosphoryl-undecaprenol N-acetylglucosamine transferase [Swaminathania salitolerans]GBQ10970.1 undecaprenyldiphospho-muramoylpentapeptide beta-N- acetylglucosaminyltransferase [Swaminathania salitolerans LMG 21291]GEL02249.1 UDP-N-acetylglucosamine--N-acetylmuramyl-(pentapeptide) pyrophosphoryl-undecaprenol N-acetylglucosamine transferase [Swaminathania salitolerans]